METPPASAFLVYVDEFAYRMVMGMELVLLLVLDWSLVSAFGGLDVVQSRL